MKKTNICLNHFLNAFFGNEIAVDCFEFSWTLNIVIHNLIMGIFIRIETLTSTKIAIKRWKKRRNVYLSLTFDFLIDTYLLWKGSFQLRSKQKDITILFIKSMQSRYIPVETRTHFECIKKCNLFIVAKALLTQRT